MINDEQLTEKEYEKKIDEVMNSKKSDESK